MVRVCVHVASWARRRQMAADIRRQNQQNQKLSINIQRLSSENNIYFLHIKIHIIILMPCFLKCPVSGWRQSGQK